MTAATAPSGSDPGAVGPSVGTADRRWSVGLGVLIVMVVAGAGTLIWTASFPGLPMVGLGLALVLGFAALVLALVVMAGATTTLKRLVIGLSCLGLAVGSTTVAVSGLPLQARFAASVADFESIVVDATARSLPITRFDVVPAGSFDPRGFPVRCPTVIGGFRLSGCLTVQADQPGAARGYLFVQHWNAITDDSAIVYLPDGPIDWAWDPPRHLSGPWYAATCGC